MSGEEIGQEGVNRHQTSYYSRPERTKLSRLKTKIIIILAMGMKVSSCNFFVREMKVSSCNFFVRDISDAQNDGTLNG